MAQNSIHHVTAIAGDARRNRDFYTRVLGLRMVKRTVNFDDPGTYHFYYGDEAGHPGSLLTFFPWAHVAPGRIGIGETQETRFRVPEGALGFWAHRFVAGNVAHDAVEKRFGESVLPFRDPDGTRLALVAVPGAEAEPAWSTENVPAENAIRGLHGVGLLLGETAATAAILTDVFGFREAGREDNVTRFEAGGLGGVIDLRAAPGFLRGRPGGGTMHHIAFRAKDDAEQAAMVEKLVTGHGVHTTEQKDRDYFRSVYFREPGGVIFEIATDEPGFTIDESASELGQSLRLPKGLEPHRKEIEAVLPELDPVAGEAPDAEPVS